MAYHWHLVPNLGTDIIVAALQPVLGITRAYWLVAAILPFLLVAGIMAIARVLNSNGAARDALGPDFRLQLSAQQRLSQLHAGVWRWRCWPSRPG